MKTIFELTRIETNSKARYPVRKIKTYDLGLFSSLANVKKQMQKDIKECREDEQKRQKYMAEDEEYRMEEKHFGHSIVLAYKIAELQLDAELGSETQSVRTYTADGQPNDECLLDSGCVRHFNGRTLDRIRFKAGDIVEVIDSRKAELCVVRHVQPTVEEYENKRQYWLENHKKRCQKWGVEYKEEDAFHWDYSDDCYLVYSLGEGNTHSHPNSAKVFLPTKPISKSLQAKFKAKYEEVLRE